MKVLQPLRRACQSPLEPRRMLDEEEPSALALLLSVGTREGGCRSHTCSVHRMQPQELHMFLMKKSVQESEVLHL